MDSSPPLLPEPPGWFGKLAPLGDFAERRLPRGFVELADPWLSEGMSTGRALLGERWLERYLTSPLWCFAWAPGIVDDGWWFGVMMPSSDNVGRYFPLLVASRRPEAPQDGPALRHLEAWFDHLAEAATATLDDGATVEAFEQALGRAPPWPAAGQSSALPPAAHRSSAACSAAGAQTGTGAGTWAGASDQDRPSAAAGLSRWLQGAAAQALLARFAGCSIWWHADLNSTASGAGVVRGLPEPSTFTGFWPAA